MLQSQQANMAITACTVRLFRVHRGFSRQQTPFEIDKSPILSISLILQVDKSPISSISLILQVDKSPISSISLIFSSLATITSTYYYPNTWLNSVSVWKILLLTSRRMERIIRGIYSYKGQRGRLTSVSTAMNTQFNPKFRHCSTQHLTTGFNSVQWVLHLTKLNYSGQSNNKKFNPKTFLVQIHRRIRPNLLLTRRNNQILYR